MPDPEAKPGLRLARNLYMRLVILTADGLEHRYVANVLSRAFPDELRAIVVAQPARRSFLGHVRVGLRRYTGSQLASRIWAAAVAPPAGGVTIHAPDEGVDSGPILRTGRPVIAGDDDEDSLFCKCVIVGAQLYERAIREVATDARHYAPQDLRQGHEYRFVDRTLAAERRVRRLLRGGLLRRFAEAPN